MITSLRGILVEAHPPHVVVEVHGVGYELLVPLSSFDHLPSPGKDVHLLTYLAVREDAHVLYGFVTAGERDLFRLLVHTVSGIGPKIALSILSGMPVDAFRVAVASGDIKSLSQISGVGRKTAERIVVELKEKVGSSTPTGSPVSGLPGISASDRALQDATLALTALGYKQPEALETVRAAQAVLGAGATVEQLVRASLRKGTG